MNEIELFNILRKEKKEVLLELLKSAYTEMRSQQRAIVFDDLMYHAITTQKTINERKILDEVNRFYNDSLAGQYYAPFMVTSKNFMDTPEETDEWCHKIAMYLSESSQLTILGKHKTAVKCFQKLFELMDRLGEDEIIFGDEVGTWMIGADEENAIKLYITSLALTTTTAQFVKYTIPLLQEDSYHSFRNNVYTKMQAVVGKEQKNALDQAIKKQGVKIKEARRRH